MSVHTRDSHSRVVSHGPARFTLLRRSSLDDFQKAVNSISDDELDRAWTKFLERNGRYIAMPDDSYRGIVIVTLLEYLLGKCKIDLLHSQYRPLADVITRACGATHVILTDAEKVVLLNNPLPNVAESELSEFFNETNQTDEPESGRAMLDGLIALQVALGHASPDKVILLEQTLR